MKTNFETISPVKKKLTVEIGAEEVDSKLKIAIPSPRPFRKVISFLSAHHCSKRGI